MPDKTKEERLREGIAILRKFQDVGIPEMDPEFQAVKNCIRTWITTGEAAAGKFPLLRFGRIADLVLPRRAANSATAVLRSIDREN